MNQLINFTAETVETFTPNSTTLFEDAKSAIMSGEANTGKIFILFHQLSETFDKLKKDPETKAAFENAFLAYGSLGKETLVHGFNITVSDRKDYDLKACGDWVYNQALKKVEEAKREVTHREIFLKAVPHEIADPETGAIIQPPTITYQRIIKLARPIIKKAA